MVKVRTQLTPDVQDKLDLQDWCAALCEHHQNLSKATFTPVCISFAEILANADSQTSENADDVLLFGVELCETVAALDMDMTSVLAGLVYRALRVDYVSPSIIEELVGREAFTVAQAVLNMASTSLLELSNSALLENEQQDQVENVKGMLAMLIDDVRVGVIKLSERVVSLRRAKHYDEARKQRVATEAAQVFAPLAGRLGIWHLKWELEDLSLRYTQGDVYQDIAKQLNSKRLEREQRMDTLVEQVKQLLSTHGIEGQVFGRAKHIYSIWRKMQSKAVDLSEVYDVQAVRVGVDNLAQCYAALGVIHNTWTHIPAEFDDYIANPKENGYQSIHTAVNTQNMGVLEVQIRTNDMHQDAELGVCAHWSYKAEASGVRDNPEVANKIDWLRQVIEWHDELDGTERLSTLLQHRVSQNRIFVSTPKGHVLELPNGATVLDFAYRVHTDLGHTCSSALVNGESADLSQRLHTGDQVAVRSTNQSPNRLWLEPALKFVGSDRARAKLVNYFRSLAELEKEQLGATIWRENVGTWVMGPEIEGLAKRIVALRKIGSLQKFYVGLGSGEIMLVAVLVDALGILAESSQLFPQTISAQTPKDLRLTIEGENRDGLLLDITGSVKLAGLALTETTGRVNAQTSQAIITVSTGVSDWVSAVILVTRINQLKGVLSVSGQIL